MFGRTVLHDDYNMFRLDCKADKLMLLRLTLFTRAVPRGLIYWGKISVNSRRSRSVNERRVQKKAVRRRAGKWEMLGKIFVTAADDKNISALMSGDR